MTAGIQPKGATNNGNLLIPNKPMTAFSQPQYGTDMRAIERWCNSLIANGGSIEELLFQSQYIIPSGDFLSVSSTGDAVDTTNLVYGPIIWPASGLIKARISFDFSYSAMGLPHALTVGFSVHGTPSSTFSPLEVMDLDESTDLQEYARRVTYEALLATNPGSSFTLDFWAKGTGTVGGTQPYNIGIGSDANGGAILASFYSA